MAKVAIAKKNATLNKKVAKERINQLFLEAADVFGDDSTLSDRYVELARRIAMKYNVSFTALQKKSFCKHCHSYLVPSVNCRVRVRNNLIVYYCLKCKNFNRTGYANISK